MAKSSLCLGTLALCLLHCVNKEASMNAQNNREANHLIHESSPYLLQHAHNPVDWYPWGEAALKKAQEEDKLLIISIGYAACHWCHVMEHESFEDSIVAQRMNTNFVSIKVDREERPDIDDIYMTACHLSTNGNCGWPLNAFALPDGRPLWAGTYFPKKNWLEVLDYFVRLKENDAEKLEDYANRLTEGVRTSELIPASQPVPAIDPGLIREFTSQLLSQIDFREGGTKGAPKFPMPVKYQFLLRSEYLYDNQKLEEALQVTLRKMAAGGLYDHLGGGFARYSVDAEWHVPHFEKMLYDNGQLVSLYSDAFRKTGDSSYLRVVRETIDFVERELMDRSGGFYSSLDADSEGEEGKYYVWSKDEVNSLLSDSISRDLFCAYYDVTGRGNWEEGKNVLRKISDIGPLAEKYNLTREETEDRLDKARAKLLSVREDRVRPGLDDKILCSWNALMLKGLLDAYKASNEPKFLSLAEKNITFIRKHFIQDDFRLLRNHKDGKSSINAFLDDYAMLIDGLIAFYQIDFDEDWLYLAKNLTDYALEHFSDDASQYFFYTSDLDPPLIARRKEIADNVIPGSNSVMAMNLYLLGHYFYDKDYLQRSEEMLKRIIPQIRETGQPGYYANWCSLLTHTVEPIYEIAIVGPNYRQLNRDLQNLYLPNAIYLGGADEGSLELLKGKLQGEETLIYVCENKVCKFPVRTVNEALDRMRH